MHRYHPLRAAALVVLAALTLVACDAGEPDVGPLSGQWQHVYGTGVMYRYELTDTRGQIAGTVSFYLLGSAAGTAPVNGTRSGTRVELDHRTHSADVTAHYVLTFESENQLMVGAGIYSDGTNDGDVLITRPLM